MEISKLATFYIIITFVLVLFQNIGTIDPASAELDWLNRSVQDNTSQAYSYQNSTEEYTSSTFWQTVMDPTDWGIGMWVLLINVIAIGAVGAFSLYALASQSYPSDTFLFAGWFVVLAFAGLYPCGLVYDFLIAELSSFMCEPTKGVCMFSKMIATIVSSGMALTWMFTVIKHWRSGQ